MARSLAGELRGWAGLDNKADQPRAFAGCSSAVSAAALRIAGIDPEWRFAGGEAQVLGLMRALADAGHHVELLCDPGGELWRRAQGTGVVCRSLRIRNSVDVAAGLRLCRLIREGRYDVLHFHTARAHALAPYAHWATVTGENWKQVARPCLIVTRRMDYVPNRLFAPWLYNRSVDGVVAISPSVADALAAAGVARSRVTLIPSGVDCTRFRPPDDIIRRQSRKALELNDDQIALGAVGMLEPRKGHRFLIEALALMAERDRDRDWRCLIAGDGSLRAEIARQIASLEASGRIRPRAIRMLGARADPYPVLAALDLFVMPSIAEGLGVAAIEAMATGLAAVASAAGGLRDLVIDRVTGVLVPPRNPVALANAISDLMGSPAMRAAMGAAARARVIEDFSLEAMARRTLALYRECLAVQL
jgi:glycosyltransferase involved in cell wall biosynthesis